MPEEKGNELVTLFPGKEVHGIKVTPITLDDMPKVMTAFGKVVSLAEAEVSPGKIAMEAMAELLQLLPYCIDKSPTEIPSTIVPDLLDIVLEQNMSKESVGKWSALVEKMVENIPGADAQSGKKA